MTVWIASLQVYVFLFLHILLFFFFFSSRNYWSSLSWTVHFCTGHRTNKLYFSVIFSLKIGPTMLFTHLKIILLQCFQFQQNKFYPNEPLNDLQLLLFFFLGKQEILLKIKGPFGWRSGKVGGWKIMGRWKIFSFPLYVFGRRNGKVRGWKTLLFSWKEKWEDRKCSLYNLTIIPLLHNR